MMEAFGGSGASIDSPAGTSELRTPVASSLRNVELERGFEAAENRAVAGSPVAIKSVAAANDGVQEQLAASSAEREKLEARLAESLGVNSDLQARLKNSTATMGAETAHLKAANQALTAKITQLTVEVAQLQHPSTSEAMAKLEAENTALRGTVATLRSEAVRLRAALEGTRPAPEQTPTTAQRATSLQASQSTHQPAAWQGMQSAVPSAAQPAVQSAARLGAHQTVQSAAQTTASAHSGAQAVAVSPPGAVEQPAAVLPPAAQPALSPSSPLHHMVAAGRQGAAQRLQIFEQQCVSVSAQSPVKALFLRAAQRDTRLEGVHLSMHDMPANNHEFRQWSDRRKAAALELLVDSPVVTTLNLVSCAITDGCCTALGAILSGGGRLAALNLERNQISATGILVLIESLKTNTTLRELSLTGQGTNIPTTVEVAFARLLEEGGATALVKLGPAMRNASERRRVDAGLSRNMDRVRQRRREAAAAAASVVQTV